MFERLANNGRKFEEATMEHVNEYADAGLRTLILAYRELDEEEYKQFDEKFSVAKNSISADREALIEEVAEKVERDLILLGATAVEDKLQNGVGWIMPTVLITSSVQNNRTRKWCVSSCAFQVPECIDKLAQAGIKIWVLTGDKMETAINIGYDL